MKKGTAIVAGVGGAAVLGGAYLLFGKKLGGLGSTVASGLSGCSGSITGGIPATLNPSYQPQTEVGGPAPGPSGQHAFPCLWAVAPKSLPTSYQGGPAITRRHGQVWLVIATNMAVTGTMSDGQNPANVGPWVGIAEYSNGTLVRVYPQQANPNALAQLGQWSGGY